MLEELGYRKPDVACDAAQENGRDITARMEGDGGSSTVHVPKLLVRALLAHLFEPELLQDGGDFTRLQNRDVAHGQAAMVTV